MIASQILVNGLITGSIYALVAAGFSLIFATNRFLHLAHGAVVTVAGYGLFVLFNLWSLDFYVSAVLAVSFASVFGWLMHIVVYRPLKRQRASSAVLLIASVALLILIQNVIQMIFDANVKAIGFLPVSRGLEIAGAVITPLQIFIILFSLLLLGALWIFIRHTKVGKTMLAVSDNPELAKISGINVEKIYGQSFLLGSGIAGVAGILVALEQNLEPLMGTPLMVKGFTGAVIGGMSFLPGSILGSYFLGLAENFGIWFVPSGWKDAIAFGLLFMFLLLRPSGIFGLDKGIRE